MGIVDTIFVGRLGAEAIGAVSLGNAMYFAVAIFGMGLLLGLDTLVSQAFGAGRLRGVPPLAGPGAVPLPGPQPPGHARPARAASPGWDRSAPSRRSWPRPCPSSGP